MSLYKCILYGLSCNLILVTDGYVLASEVIANHLSSISFDCYELNYEYEKLSELRDGVGGLNKDDNVYKEGFEVVTQRVLVSEFGTVQSSLVNVLENEYKSILVCDYDFIPYPNTYAMPFEVESFSVERGDNRKWYSLKLVKSNAE